MFRTYRLCRWCRRTTWMDFPPTRVRSGSHAGCPCLRPQRAPAESAKRNRGEWNKLTIDIEHKKNTQTRLVQHPARHISNQQTLSHWTEKGPDPFARFTSNAIEFLDWILFSIFSLFSTKIYLKNVQKHPAILAHLSSCVCVAGHVFVPSRFYCANYLSRCVRDGFF